MHVSSINKFLVILNFCKRKRKHKGEVNMEESSQIGWNETTQLSIKWKYFRNETKSANMSELIIIMNPIVTQFEGFNLLLENNA